MKEIHFLMYKPTCFSVDQASDISEGEAVSAPPKILQYNGSWSYNFSSSGVLSGMMKPSLIQNFDSKQTWFTFDVLAPAIAAYRDITAPSAQQTLVVRVYTALNTTNTQPDVIPELEPEQGRFKIAFVQMKGNAPSWLCEIILEAESNYKQ